MIFSDVFEDEDGWFRFSVTTPAGIVVESDEFFYRENALDALKYICGSEEETAQFLRDFDISFENLCPVCNRPADDTMDKHHLRPKCKKGKELVSIHRCCHNFIHATFTDKELAREYNTIALLMADARMQKWANWVSKKPLNFLDSSTMSNRKNPNKRK